MLLCCKFAEGDSRILQQKLTRDRLKAMQKGGAAAVLGGLLTSERAEVLAADTVGGVRARIKLS